MSKQINIIAGEAVSGGVGVGIMTATGNPWTVADGLADELVNRRKATYITGQPMPSQWGSALWGDPNGTQLLKPDGTSVSLASGGGATKVRAASTANINLAAPGAALDGVTLTSGTDSFLAKDQTAPAENGLYLFNGAAAPATRLNGFTAYDLIAGATVAVTEGTTNHDTLWLCSSDVGGTLGTTALAFTETDFTDTRVRAALLTGLDTSSTTQPTSASSVLLALGRIIAKLWGTATLSLNMLATQADKTVLMNRSGGSASPIAVPLTTLAADLGVAAISGGVSLTDPLPAIWGPRSYADNQWAQVGMGTFSAVDSCTFTTGGSGPQSTDGSFGNWLRARQTAAAVGTGRIAGMQLGSASIKIRLDNTGSKRGRLPFKQSFALASATSTHGVFFGITTTTLSTYANQPSAWATDHIAVTADSSESTYRLQYRDNAGTVVRKDLGANFPKSQHRPITLMIDRDDDGSNLRAYVYDWVSGTTDITYINTGAVPRTTVDYGIMLFATNGTDTTTACAIDIGIGSLGNFGYAVSNKQDIGLVLGDKSSTITATGTNLNQWLATYTGNLVDIITELKTACSSGTFTVDVKKNGTSIFTTLVTIDATETSSITAATPFVLAAPVSFIKGDVFTVDITVTGTGGIGPVCHLIVQPR